MSAISLFSSIHALCCQACPLDLYLSQVQEGQWRQPIEHFRQHPETHPPAGLPVVALSGLFRVHAAGLVLIHHSGFIAMDLDGFDDHERGKRILAQDRYTYAVFENASGQLLTVVVPIRITDQATAYQALSDYYSTAYGLITDPMDQWVTRLRLVSYDPFLCGNPQAELFA